MRWLVRAAQAGVIAFGLAVGAIAIDGGEPAASADCAVVLGNKVELDGTPSTRLAARLGRALSLYQNGEVSRILVSGGFGVEGYDESAVMRDWLIQRGVPPADVLADPDGDNTRLTAQNAAQILGTGTSVIAVSQRFHVSRSKMALRQEGFATVYGAAPDYSELRDIYGYVREVPAWAKYWLQGR